MQIYTRSHVLKDESKQALETCSFRNGYSGNSPCFLLRMMISVYSPFFFSFVWFWVIWRNTKKKNQRKRKRAERSPTET